MRFSKWEIAKKTIGVIYWRWDKKWLKNDFKRLIKI